MQTFAATEVQIDDEGADYGYARVNFTWPDPVYAHETLRWDIGEDHLSRNMAFYSGPGPLSVELERARIVLQLPPATAQQMRLEEEIEITFALSDEDFTRFYLLLREAGLIPKDS